MASKMVVDRQRRGNRLRLVLEKFRAETVQGIVKRLGCFVDENADLAAAVDCLMGAVDGLLTADTKNLVEADECKIRALSRIEQLRKQRDRAARELRRVLVLVRQAAACFFGREAGNAYLGVAGPTARAHQHDRLIAQVRVALESLRDPARKLPRPQEGVKAGVDFGEGLKLEWIGLLDTALTPLSEALDELKDGDRETFHAQFQKGVRMELHDDELSAIANLQEALLILGRNRKAARSVWKRQRPVGRPARWKSRRSKAMKRAAKESRGKTTTRDSGSRVSSKEVASS
jgi:hypothetical protein